MSLKNELLKENKKHMLTIILRDIIKEQMLNYNKEKE